mmetsp:Transcript_28206/g.61380  ORF Transcript_28206/g.61380 Transcript_28206/m.61380 type:complete len:96 (+) Transcript_28206:756-1043(+)
MTYTRTTSPSKVGKSSLFLAPARAHDRRTVLCAMDTSWWLPEVVVAVFASVMCGALIRSIFVGPRSLLTQDLGRRDKATVPPLLVAGCLCLEVAR